LIIVTRPPGAIVTLDGEMRPSVPIVIVAVVGFGPDVGGGVVTGGVGGVGVVGVLLLPLPHAAAMMAATLAAARQCFTLVISKISSKD
jgi:hypothetical protein